MLKLITNEIISTSLLTIECVLWSEMNKLWSHFASMFLDVKHFSLYYNAEMMAHKSFVADNVQV